MGALGIALRRYAEGGEVEGDLYQPQQMPQGPMMGRTVQQMPSPVAPGGSAPALPQGAIAQQLNPDNVDPQAAEKIQRMQMATAILQAGGALPSQQPGGINVPLLAAAGAMLSPTRTGGFAESLGNAMTHGATAVQAQRQQDELARSRQMQAASLSDWRTGMLGVNQQNADTRQFVAQRTAQLKAQGMEETAAYRQAVLEARVYAADTRAESVRYAADSRADTAANSEAGKQARFLASQAAKTEDQRLRALGLSSRQVNTILGAVSRDIQVMTGKKPLSKAVDEYMRQNQALMGQLNSRDGTGGGAAPPPQRQQPGANAPNPSIAPRAATSGELDRAREALKRDPAARETILQRFRDANITPPADL